MTVSASSTRELDINRICKLALQAAGLLPAGAPMSGVQWEKLSGQARDFLEVELDALQAEGVVARAVEFYDVTLVAGTTTYALPGTTVSVIGDAMFLKTGETSGETLVRSVDRTRYHELSDKVAQGTPTLMFVETHAVFTLYLWPVPSDAGTLRIQRQRLLADASDGTKTVDLERYWVKYMVMATAHMLALSNGIDPSKVGYLNSKAGQLLNVAKARSGNATPGQVEYTHSTGWTR